MNKKLKKVIADRIAKNGGYYGGPFPLSWSVALYNVKGDWDEVLPMALACEDFNFKGFCKSTMRRAIAKVAGWYDMDRMWEIVQHRLYENLSDDDYRTCSPNVFEKWNLKEQYFDVKFELRGRGGKHLVIREFEGVQLYRMSNDDLLEEMNNFEEDWIRKLAAFMEECDRMFTPNKASEEYNYQLAWIVANRIHDTAEEIEETRTKERRRKKQAILNSLEMFV